MIIPELYTRRGERRIATLKKREAHLRKRISESDKSLSYDEQEASALKWVISIVENLMRGE